MNNIPTQRNIATVLSRVDDSGVITFYEKSETHRREFPQLRLRLETEVEVLSYATRLKQGDVVVIDREKVIRPYEWRDQHGNKVSCELPGQWQKGSCSDELPEHISLQSLKEIRCEYKYPDEEVYELILSGNCDFPRFELVDTNWWSWLPWAKPKMQWKVLRPVIGGCP